MKTIYILVLCCISLFAQAQIKPYTLGITALGADDVTTDKASISFNPLGNSGLDELDELKTSDTTLLSLYCELQGNRITHNTLKEILETPYVPLNFYCGETGLITFTFDGLSSFDPSTTIFIEDKRQHIVHNVRSGIYLFYADVADAKDRFVVRFSPAVEITTAPATCNQEGKLLMEEKGTETWSFILYGANQNQIVSGVLDNQAPVEADIPGGTYTLTVRNDFNFVWTKTITITKPESLTTSFLLTNNKINVGDWLTVTATGNAQSHFWDFGDGTEINGQTATHKYSTAGVYTITLTTTESGKCASTTQKTIEVSNEMISKVQSIHPGDVRVWNNQSDVMIDFLNAEAVHADISITNILGQQLLQMRHEQNSVATIPVNHLSVDYVLVKVSNQGRTSVTKLWIK